MEETTIELPLPVSLSDRKVEREIEKLELEIKALRKFYRNPQFWASGAALLASAFAIIYGFVTGFFSNQNVLLQTQKEKLQLETVLLSNEKKLIADSIARYRTQADSLRTGAKKLKSDLIMEQIGNLLRIKEIQLYKLTSDSAVVTSDLYEKEKISISENLNEIDKLLIIKDNHRALIKLQALTIRLQKFTGKNFSDDFNSDFK
jgi:hypothetical protein